MEGQYELERIVGHTVDDFGGVQYKVTWKFWPPSSASLLSKPELKDTAAELLAEYHESRGITPFHTEEEELLLLTDTALPEPPIIHKRTWVVQILGHRKVDGEDLFDTQFNTGEIVMNRPRYAFTAEFEKDMLHNYCWANLPGSSKSSPVTPRQREVEPETSSSRPARNRTGLSRFSPSPDVVVTRHIKPGPAGDRSRSPSPDIISEDSDASVFFRCRNNNVGKSSVKRATRSSVKKSLTMKESVTSAFTTPKSSRGRVSATKRASAPNTKDSAQKVVVKKAKYTVDKDYSEKIPQSIYKDENGVWKILIKDQEGAHTVQTLDDAFNEDKHFTYDAMKKLLLEKRV